MPLLGPIPIIALKPLACGSVAWRRAGHDVGRPAGALEVTIVAKGSFGLVPDGDARMIAPRPIVAEDRHVAGGGSLGEPGDLAPFLPSAGVVVTGHASPPVPVPAMTVRVALFRDRPLLDKAIHVFGDRPPGVSRPQPFQRLPIVYERAYGGPAFADNPVGVGAPPDARSPNLVNPADARRTACFGPVSPRWGSRRRLLGARGAPTMLDAAPFTEIPEGFDFRWFHAAPADQQCDYLQGDEWIVLDGFDASRARLQTRLPSVRGHAVWVLPGHEGRHVDLLADSLVVDGDRHQLSVVWRGRFTLERPEQLPLVQVFATVEMPGYPAVWPDEARLAPRPEASPSGGRDGGASAGRPRSVPSADSGNAAQPLAPPNPPDREPPSDRAPTEKIVVGRLRAATLQLPKRADPAPAPSPVANPVDSARARPTGRDAPSAEEDEGETLVTRGDQPAGEALPFKPGAPMALPPPSAPSPNRRLGNTETAVTSPFFVLPFVPAPREESPPAPTGPVHDGGSPGPVQAGSQASPGPGSAPMPPAAAKSAWSEDGESTKMIDPAKVAAGSATPFATPGPAAKAQGAAPLPGAPWSEPAAPIVPATAPEAETIRANVADLNRRLAERSASSAPPSPVPPAPPPASVAPPPPAILAPEPVAAPSPPADSGIRATVAGRLKAREPLRDLALAGADLRDLDLGGADLSGLDLRGAKLVRARLVDTRLGDAQLGDAAFDEADLTGADLTGAFGRGASFTGVKAARARFARGEWDEASFARADLTCADFTGASVARARFEGAVLEEARLTDARGEGAVFDDARLVRVHAHGASLRGASLRRADATGSLWETADLDDAKLDGATLRDANLGRAKLERATLAGAVLEGARLQRLAADGADFREARLDGADLRQARARGAGFERASLKALVAAKADFEGGRFTDANLGGASLRAARLVGAMLVRANLEGADLRDAELEGANVFGAARRTAKIPAGARGLVEVDPGDSA